MYFVFLILIKEIQKIFKFLFFPIRIKKKEFLLYVYIVEKRRKEEKKIMFVVFLHQTYAKSQ